MLDAGDRLGLEFTVEQHLHSYRRAADRTRHVYFAILIVSVLAFGGYINSRQLSWTNLRIAQARTAFNWQLRLEDRQHAEELIAQCWLEKVERDEPCEAIENAWKMVQVRRLWRQEDVGKYLEQLQEVQVAQVLNFSVPFFGLRFDVNDLGLLSALAITLLTLTLLLSLAREHENLFLCMWLVRELHANDLERARLRRRVTAEAADLRMTQASEANLVYHELAMAQLFSRPPTLARRWSSWIGRSIRLLFLVPVGVQFLLLAHDLKTARHGFRLSPDSTIVSLLAQCAAFIILCIIVRRCLSYTRATGRLWKVVFDEINPRLVKEIPWRTYIDCRPLTRRELHAAAQRRGRGLSQSVQGCPE